MYSTQGKTVSLLFANFVWIQAHVDLSVIKYMEKALLDPHRIQFNKASSVRRPPSTNIDLRTLPPYERRYIGVNFIQSSRHH